MWEHGTYSNSKNAHTILLHDSIKAEMKSLLANIPVESRNSYQDSPVLSSRPTQRKTEVKYI